MFRELVSYFGLTILILFADIVICLGSALLLDKNDADESSWMILAIINTLGFAIALSFLILGVPVTK